MMHQDEMTLIDEKLLIYRRGDGTIITYLVEDRAYGGPPESVLRARTAPGEQGYTAERLFPGEWEYYPDFSSLQFDGLLNEVTLEVARETAVKLGLEFL